MQHYKTSVKSFYWVEDSDYVDEELIDLIRNFPVMEDQWYKIKQGDLNFEFRDGDIQSYSDSIIRLLNLEISALINISESLKNLFQESYSPVQYFLVIRGSLPVYVKSLWDKNDVKSELISGFVSALSGFLRDVVEGEGAIEKVSHDQGTILIHTKDDYKYILLSNSDDVHLRISLRQFAYQTENLIENVSMNQFADTPTQKELDKIFENIFFV